MSSDPRDLTTLGKDLAKHTKRRTPFNYSMLSKFTLGKATVTLELAEALCKEYSRLPPPFFIARTYNESVHIQAIVERHHDEPDENTHEAPIVTLPKPGERAPKRRARGATSADPAPAASADSLAARRRSRG